ncbi:hypothetical protein LCGC14_1751370 [marine sediment metagenome]|uniref:Uncharacterized protein n=1 Tax=marine sediment metagenome TaxID=412755 RepID=A0A0F9JIU5_9ZZZZ
MGKLIEEVRCPVCNRVYPTGFWPKIASVTKDCLGYLKEALGNKGFPIVKELTLRREIRPETLAIVKSRILGAVKLWLQKGWLDADELVAVMDNIEQERVSGWRVLYTYEGPGFHPVSSTYGRVSVARPLRMPLNKVYEEVKL